MLSFLARRMTVLLLATVILRVVTLRPARRGPELGFSAAYVVAGQMCPIADETTTHHGDGVQSQSGKDQNLSDQAHKTS